MTFDEAKQTKAGLEADADKWSRVLNAFPKGPTGLTPDAVRATAEYREANTAYKQAAEKLRKFNAWFTKEFKREYAADRRARGR